MGNDVGDDVAAGHDRPLASSGSLARVAEWQTRRTQNPLSERACGFESHLGHKVAPCGMLFEPGRVVVALSPIGTVEAVHCVQVVQ